MLRSGELRYYNKRNTFDKFIIIILVQYMCISILSFIIRNLKLYRYVKGINFSTNTYV